MARYRTIQSANKRIDELFRRNQQLWLAKERAEGEAARLRDALEDAATEAYSTCRACERVAEITYKALGWGNPAYVEPRKEQTT